MIVGDLVKPTKESKQELACGTGRYDCAVVISINPFMLTSLDSSMLWTDTIKETEFEVIGDVGKRTLNECMKRLKIKIN
jgi:hypothetical protein